jgi:hypothetical protein
LVDRKVKPKQVIAVANVDNPERCVVRLFVKYISKRPQGAPDAVFYLQPLLNWSDSVWYSRKPVGHNKLASTVKRLCTEVGVSGYKTNHSLRRTAATRLFQAGCDEQLIMDVMGHRSIDGVRQYKEVSHDQRKALSDVIQNPSKKPKYADKDGDTQVDKSAFQDIIQKSFTISGNIQNLVINITHQSEKDL